MVNRVILLYLVFKYKNSNRRATALCQSHLLSKDLTGQIDHINGQAKGCSQAGMGK